MPSFQSRGSIARSLAYFGVRYDLIDELKQVIDINTMLKWNIDHPVNFMENHKNIIAYKYHNILNPFITNPEIMPYCFKDLCTIDMNELYKNNENLYTINKFLDENKIFQKNNKILNDFKKKMNK